MILLLTGESGVGKTTLCRHAAELFKAKGLRVAGVLTVPRFAHGAKIGMDVQDIRTGERRALADHAPIVGGPTTENWDFHANGLIWGAQVLLCATPCDVLVIDELGPLELERGQGWTVGIDLLQECRYRLAIVVVRRTLLANLRAQLKGREVLALTVTRTNEADLIARIGVLAGSAG